MMFQKINLPVLPKKLKEVTNQLEVSEKSQKRLSKALLDKGNKKAKRKSWSDCSVQYQRKRKRQIEEEVKTALLFTENEGFKPLNVELLNTDTQETIQVVCGRHQETESSKEDTIKKHFMLKRDLMSQIKLTMRCL